MRVKKWTLMAGVAALSLVAGVAQATDTDYQGFQAGDILVRARGVAVIPTTGSEVSTIGGQVDATNSFIPEADVSYFFTPNIAVEAIAGVTGHSVTDRNSSLGNVNLGHVWLLPPTVTAQYHFLPKSVINPYVGFGVNYTVFFNSDMPSGMSVHYQNSWGGALQAGADFHLEGNWYANVDIKHIFLSTTATIDTGSTHLVSGVNIDPTIVGAGIGYKF